MQRDVFFWIAQEKYASLQNGNVPGLYPYQRLLPFDEIGRLPLEAHVSVVPGFLQAEPREWVDGTFPEIWHHTLLEVICESRREVPDILVLKTRLEPQDEAWVFDFAHIERELEKPFSASTPSSRNAAQRRYWASRVPHDAYGKNYTLPHVVITTPIEHHRLELVRTVGLEIIPNARMIRI